MNDPDYQMALVLQKQFNLEIPEEIPKNNLYYEDTKKKTKNKENHNPKECLVDPSWELVDPTPDVHVLFVSFNGRFFWNKLGSVTVSWSKRMTVCAGICSYESRGKVSENF